MAKISQMVLASASLLILAGCHHFLTGTWTKESVSPPKVQDFDIRTLSFKAGKSYQANMVLDGKPEEQSGSYEFNGFQLMLTPKPGTGKKQAYDATLMMGKLKVSHKDSAGKSVTVTLTKVK